MNINAIIAYPITDFEANSQGTLFRVNTRFEPVDSQRLRRVGLYTDNRFTSYLVDESMLSESVWPNQSNVTLEKLEIFKNAETKILVCYFAISDTPDNIRKILDELRRPGTAQIKNAIANLGLQVDASSQIRATTALRISDAELNEVRDAGIEVSDAVPQFLFEKDWSLLLALICAERMLLDQVSEFLASGDKSHRRSQKFLRKIVQWQTVLGSDSTNIQVSHEKIRESLRLDDRYQQNLEILKEDLRLSERRWNVLGLFAGISATLLVLPEEFKAPESWIRR